MLVCARSFLNLPRNVSVFLSRCTLLLGLFLGIWQCSCHVRTSCFHSSLSFRVCNGTLCISLGSPPLYQVPGTWNCISSWVSWLLYTVLVQKTMTISTASDQDLQLLLLVTLARCEGLWCTRSARKDRLTCLIFDRNDDALLFHLAQVHFFLFTTSPIF